MQRPLAETCQQSLPELISEAGQLAGLVQAKGLRYVDCPVAGRPDAAEVGELDEVRPIEAGGPEGGDAGTAGDERDAFVAEHGEGHGV